MLGLLGFPPAPKWGGRSEGLKAELLPLQVAVGQPGIQGKARSPPSSHPFWGPGGSPAIQAYREALQAATPFGARGAALQVKPSKNQKSKPKPNEIT
jgi:hypothetical protein